MPPIVVKLPPAKILVPETASFSTELPPPAALGFQVASRFPFKSNFARRLRVVIPFTSVKIPPAYTLVPSETSE